MFLYEKFYINFLARYPAGYRISGKKIVVAVVAAVPATFCCCYCCWCRPNPLTKETKITLNKIVLQASVHPCKHAQTMKKLLDQIAEGGGDLQVLPFPVFFLSQFLSSPSLSPSIP